MSNLNGTVALITGANSGIGFATAQEFIAQGARVIITGRNAESVAEAAKALGPHATGILADQGNLAHLDTLAQQVKEQFGQIDALFINAGVAFFAPLDLATEAHYDSIMDVNVKGAYFTAQKLAPLVKEGGAILFNASTVSGMGIATSSVYAASKAALVSFTKVLATELGPRRIRVNAVSPGPISTPIYGKLGMTEEQIAGFGAAMSDSVPLKRFGQADEIAKAAVLLLTKDGSYINGTDLVVDGGVGINAGV